MNYPFSGIVVRYLRHQAAAEMHTVERPMPLQDQLHVNLWDIADKAYLDIGLMVSEPESISEIWIDVPWRVEPRQVVDLGPGLDGDKILTAIFNEVASYSGVSGQHYAVVTLGSHPNQDIPFLLVRLDQSRIAFSQIAIDTHSEVTRLQIRWPALKFSDPTHEGLRRYIRIRLTHVHMDAFFSTFRAKDRNLLSSSPITRLLDFRVNVRRGVPDQVLLGEPALEFPSLKKVHVFAIVPRETELPFQGEGYKGCRSLEDEEIWNGYINLPHRSHAMHGESVKDYLGYQWTASSKNDVPAKDLVALGRFVHVTSSRWTNARFLVVVMLLGTLGSAIWDEVKAVLGNADSKDQSWKQLPIWAIVPLSVLLILLITDRATARALAKFIKQTWTSRTEAISSWWRGL
ncbi:hypothetical protein QZM46_29970 [Burkholderia vietnamiensis]|uniref:hypothetical protein n=1 Tax=Burkholderia vietnamiensis TaxID=60552 RepID=UPI00264C0CE1|nr:hypothetical protein [Burkholderia vietnamiensis]MDN7555542.1 hypothetical protein [Burkholderia vietnamiensis]HDR9095100.1 hypothetical protein [Burkholderia vietnamiensis]